MYIGIALLVLALGLILGIFIRKRTFQSNQDKVNQLRDEIKKQINKKD